jgi:hypothetical protein
MTCVFDRGAVRFPLAGDFLNFYEFLRKARPKWLIIRNIRTELFLAGKALFFSACTIKTAFH